MLRGFIAGTKAALSPSNIRQGMRDAQAMAEGQSAVMPNGRADTGLHPSARAGDPVDAAQAAAERAAARARYAAPDAVPARIDRFSVPGTDPAAGLRVLSWAGVPALSHQVWGCYPSAAVAHPGHLVDGRLGVAATALGPITLPWVEWTVVHAAGPELAGALTEAAAAVATSAELPGDVEHVTLARAESWLDRPRTDALPFDEDLAALLCHTARVDPATCLGVHRRLEWGLFGMAPQRHVMVEPAGIELIGRPEARLREARAALARSAPTRFRADDDLSVHVAALDLSVAFQVEPWPWTQGRPPTTRYPGVPADTDELLLAYLEIVGVGPADCFGVSTTVRDQQAGRVLPGDTVRGDAAGLATVVHFDHDDFAEGRRRFAAWCDDVVGAVLVDRRQPVDAIDRWGVRALKLKNLDTMGLGTYREHDVGQEMDTAFYLYSAGPKPTP